MDPQTTLTFLWLGWKSPAQSSLALCSGLASHPFSCITLVPLLSLYPSPPSRQATPCLALLMPRGLKENATVLTAILPFSPLVCPLFFPPLPVFTWSIHAMLQNSAYLFMLLAYESKKKKKNPAHKMRHFEETKLEMSLHLIKNQIFKHQF